LSGRSQFTLIARLISHGTYRATIPIGIGGAATLSIDAAHQEVRKAGLLLR